MTILRNPTNDAYAEAGVSIEAGNALVERIKPHAKSTTRLGVLGGLGGFGAIFDIKALGLKDPLLISTTDGVGTKLKLATEMKKHATIGIDLVAMCVNDLVVQGAEPLYFLDYFATGALDVAQAEQVIAGIAEGCRQAGCALTGGETAEMPGMYKPAEYDLAGFSVGAVERDALLPRDVSEGDVLLGLASSGVHSNGYSLVRKIIADGEFHLTDPTPFLPPLPLGEGRGLSPEASAKGDEGPIHPPQTLGDALLTPTRIYVRACLSAIRSGGVHALAHITGGGLTENLPRVLPAHLSAHIDRSSWQLPPVFTWLSRSGRIDDAIMLRTFNCGIGMVLCVAPSEADRLTTLLTNTGETVHRIGTLRKRDQDAVIYS